MLPKRGDNLRGRFRKLAQLFVKPEEPQILELIWGGDEPSFGLTFMPDGTTLNYPISYPHLNPALHPPFYGDNYVPPREDPKPSTEPIGIPDEELVGEDPVLRHHVGNARPSNIGPPVW